MFCVSSTKKLNSINEDFSFSILNSTLISAISHPKEADFKDNKKFQTPL